MVDPADTVTRPLPQPTRLRFSSPGRTYEVVLTQDLFGQWTVIHSWGGKQSYVESFEAGLAALQAIARKREKGGYSRVI